MTTPHFLRALELDVSADERAIRRAYAAKLKKIDQEADPAAFQALRAAYDAALNWSRHAARPVRATATVETAEPVATVETVETTQPAEPAALAGAAHSSTRAAVVERVPVQPQAQPASRHGANEPAEAERQADPIALAAATLSDFVDAFHREAESARWDVDRQAWQAKLEHILTGDTLVNMAARDAFELRYASLLTQGWKPGHEVLFAIAASAFNWDDRKRLKGLGHVGNILDRAMLERAMFDRQPPSERGSQRAVIQRLRNPAAPTRKEVVLSFSRTQQVIQRFPTWLGMITDVSSFARWQALQAALPAHLLRRSTTLPQAPNEARERTRSSKFRLAVVCFVLALVATLANLAHGPSKKLPQAQMTQAQERARAAMQQIFDTQPSTQTMPPPSKR